MKVQTKLGTLSPPGYVSISLLTLCILETPKRVLLQTVKTHMKCSIMHFIRATLKHSLGERNSILVCNYNHSVYMYNAFVGYCIVKGGNPHQKTKG